MQYLDRIIINERTKDQARLGRDMEQMFQQGRQNERMVDASASCAEEGRGNAAKSLGESLAGNDPEISEWGNPAERLLRKQREPGELKHLRYPEEEKVSR